MTNPLARLLAAVPDLTLTDELGSVREYEGTCPACRDGITVTLDLDEDGEVPDAVCHGDCDLRALRRLLGLTE